jgi:hypothetical protein
MRLFIAPCLDPRLLGIPLAMNASPHSDDPAAAESPLEPYAPPRSSTDRSDRVQRLGRVVQFGLSVMIVCELVAIASSWMQLQLLGTDFTDAAIEANDVREGFVALAYVVCMIPVAILFLRWIYVAKKDLRELRIGAPKFSPGWSVGWFFVPILNLWKPYQAMAETYRGTDAERMAAGEWREAPVGAVVKAWWTFWVLDLFVGRVSWRLYQDAATIEELEAATQAEIVSSLVALASTVTAIALVNAIGARRGERRAALERLRAAR